MNILITAAGRRSYLINYFKEAMKGNGMIIAANSVDHVPSFAVADKSVVTPISYDANYIPFLVQYCKNNFVDAILSLYDVDVAVLARNKKEFDRIGTKLIVSSNDFVKICNDKWLTFLYLSKNGFKTPKTYLTLKDAENALQTGVVDFPVIVKPRFGNGSIALNTAHDMQTLREIYTMTQEEVRKSWLKYESAGIEDIVIVQECLQGQEYGIDIMNDLSGNFRSASVKMKIAMRSGETDRAITVDDPRIHSEVVRLGKMTGHIANLDCDGFLVENDFYILEMNARFGGGYPFSHMAGVNLPLAIVKWLNNESVDDALLTPEIGVETYKEIEIRRWK